MTRLHYADPAAMDEETRALHARLAPLNIFRVMAHSGPALRGFLTLGNALLYKGRLDPILREMAIVRTGLLCGSRYEVHQHEKISLDLGMAPEKLAALREGPEAPVFTELERLVLRFTDEVTRDVKASEATFRALAERLGPAEMVELTLTVGYYGLVSRFLETMEIEIEEGLAGPPMKLPRRPVQDPKR
ncbi:MAG: carboxymuconolactone decarboxylase family protein [Alphaproteobacteria bacterium]|nr:carboxymuconolactone decarboxylase family protein [Alphaproteobacteria bacterium]